MRWSWCCGQCFVALGTSIRLITVTIRNKSNQASSSSPHLSDHLFPTRVAPYRSETAYLELYLVASLWLVLAIVMFSFFLPVLDRSRAGHSSEIIQNLKQLLGVLAGRHTCS